MATPFKRFVAIGCTHGELVDQDAFAAVMGFCGRYKPHTRVHLGDIGDYAAFRNGAKGTADEARHLGPDIKASSDLIAEYRPTHVLIGNHDVRIFKQAESKNALVALAAGHARNEFLTACSKAKVKELVDHYDINRSWITLGDAKFLHGFPYGENAIRDTAEHFGKCVFAHLHTPGIARARRSDHAAGYCVGTLANIPAMDYACTRRATARWAHGFVFGEYNDTECHVNLSEGEPNKAGSWRLPL